MLGKTIGKEDGTILGNEDGTIDGAILGMKVVGETLGNEEGKVESSVLGIIVRIKLGLNVGKLSGEAVGKNVGMMVTNNKDENNKRKVTKLSNK
jgi:hypothetical protein